MEESGKMRKELMGISPATEIGFAQIRSANMYAHHS
jgi:hypothetical protein